MWKKSNLIIAFFVFLLSFAMERAILGFSPAPMRIMYEDNEIFYFHMSQDRQIVCRIDGTVEVYSDSFQKRNSLFSIGEISGHEKIIFLEDNNSIVKIAEHSEGRVLSLYEIDSGNKKVQVVLEDYRIFDLKMIGEHLHYLSSGGYCIYDIRNNNHKGCDSFPAFPKEVEAAFFGSDEIPYVLFGEIQIAGFNAYTPIWKKQLDADNYSIERHFVQPKWPYYILFYDAIGENKSFYECISLNEGKVIWRKSDMESYTHLRGVSANCEYQVWFKEGEVYLTRMPDIVKTMRIPSVTEPVDVLFDLKNMQAFCIPSVRVISEDKENNRIFLARSSHTVKVVDLNNGNLISELTLPKSVKCEYDIQQSQ